MAIPAIWIITLIMGTLLTLLAIALQRYTMRQGLDMGKQANGRLPQIVNNLQKLENAAALPHAADLSTSVIFTTSFGITTARGGSFC